METIVKLEKTLAGWYKQLPFHLPLEGRKWLAENAWWLVLIGVIASVLSIVGSLRSLFWAQDLSNSVLGDLAAYYGAPVYNPWVDGSLWVGLVSFAIILVLEVAAINPLKVRAKRGWDLIFLTMLVGAIAAVVSVVVTGSMYGLLGAAVGVVVGGFFLFEVREQFGARVSGTGPVQPKN